MIITVFLFFSSLLPLFLLTILLLFFNFIPLLFLLIHLIPLPQLHPPSILPPRPLPPHRNLPLVDSSSFDCFSAVIFLTDTRNMTTVSFSSLIGVTLCSSHSGLPGRKDTADDNDFTTYYHLILLLQSIGFLMPWYFAKWKVLYTARVPKLAHLILFSQSSEVHTQPYDRNRWCWAMRVYVYVGPMGVKDLFKVPTLWPPQYRRRKPYALR